MKNVPIYVQFLLVACLLSGSNQVGAEQVKSPALKIMSLNTYSFPAKSSAFLKKITLGKKDLVSGINKPIVQRVDEIAQFVKSKQPDIVIFQELWKNDNKERMILGLGTDYPHVYYIPLTVGTQVADYGKAWGNLFAEAWKNKANLFYKGAKVVKPDTLLDLIPLKMDNGLLIASKFPIFFKSSFIYTDRADDEMIARKGALIIGIKDRTGSPIIFVNTHLQSGTRIDFIEVKDKQMRQLAQELKKVRDQNPEFKNARIIIAGDMNEPILLHEHEKGKWRFIERNNYLIKALNESDIPVSNKQLMNILIPKYNVDHVIEINELEQIGTIKSPEGKVIGRLKKAKPRLDAKGNPIFEKGTPLLEKGDPLLDRLDFNSPMWAYWAVATEPKGKQLLDYFFLDDKSKLINFQVFRKEVLGDAGPQMPFNENTAISDHAAIMVEINPA